VVEGDPAPDACLGLRSAFPSVQLDAFILQGSPEAPDEDVVEAAPLAVHRDLGADPFQPVGPGEGGDLAVLIRVHYLRREAMDRLVQRLDTEVRLEGVRDASGQHLAREPVHDGDQIEEASSHQ
jgi:hypothetical protein